MITNIFENCHFDPEGEIDQAILLDHGIQIRRICSSGQAGPVYDQEQNEWVTLLEGEAEILFVDDGERIRLTKGDHLLLEAGRRHRVTFTSDRCLWLCVFWDKKQ